MQQSQKRIIEKSEELPSKRVRNEDNSEDEEDMPLMPADNDIEIAECGTISKVELHNFMCHEYLKVDLGPKINFITGHNGSGKSAILTAIIVALSAAAHTTDLANNLGSLIKEGQDSALVIIYLTNRGDNPFKPDIYPDQIRVECCIDKDGDSSYTIKNSSNRVISTKREDLVAICDHMMLLVSNPLTMLTQDMACRFLSDSSAHEKYKLFIQATQIQSQYDEIHKSLDTNRTTTKQRINRWETIRNFISLHVRAYFRYYLQNRGYSGSLKINHRDQTLEVRVSTSGDQSQESALRLKDLKLLSGGEKSFIQISLLLSLWQSVGSQVFCLDKFDVFMDAVHRKHAMKMIMDAASDTRSQYILITSQDDSNMVPGPHVTIHRMRDPERHSLTE